MVIHLARRDFLKLMGVAATAAAAPRFGHAAPTAVLAGKRPNIILILSDDQGYGDLGRHGNKVIRTPNLDRLYDQAVRFTDFRVSPTCAPTRTSIMTGRHEFKSGVTHTNTERERMSLKATTIAQVLKAAGYATGIFGKWHMGDEPAYWPDKRGFEEMFIHGAGGIGQTFPGTCGDVPGNRYFDPVVLHNGTFEKTAGYCTDVFFGQAAKWIDSVKGKKPFFAYITPNAPHAPLDCPEKYEKMYADMELPTTGGEKINKGQVAKYLGMVTNLDENVGMLLAKLQEAGIENDTLVIFMNDNGGTFGCPVFNAGMHGDKGTPFNGGTRAMSLWRWPGVLQAGDVDRLAAHIDLFPTFAALAGGEIPAEVAGKLDGYSLLPLLADPKGDWPADRMIFTHVGRWPAGADPRKFKYSNCSVRWRQYLLVCGDRKSKQAKPVEKGWKLFDVAADPAEKDNLMAGKADVVAKMNAAYDQWWDSVLPCLENEAAAAEAERGGVRNPFKELYWKQFKGPGPNNVAPPAEFKVE